MFIIPMINASHVFLHCQLSDVISKAYFLPQRSLSLAKCPKKEMATNAFFYSCTDTFISGFLHYNFLTYA